VVNRRRLLETGSRARIRVAGDARLTARIREGDDRAFEAVYDRYADEMLRFGVYMLGSRHDAEDAVQATFTAAWGALRADGRPVALRPWLFTITRNECVTVLRGRRPTAELNGELAITDDPVEHLMIGEDLRMLLASIAKLPEQQRAALLLAEAHGLTHPEIASVLGARTDQIKAFVYQARANLIADRMARESDCGEIRAELEESRGHGLLRGAIRRHLRDCPGCRQYADGLSRRRRQLRATLPFVPSLALKHRALEGALGLGGLGGYGSTAVGAPIGGLAEVAGGVSAVVFKIAAGAVALSVTAGVGVSALAGSQRSTAPGAAARRIAAADVSPAAAVRPRARRTGSGFGARRSGEGRGSSAAAPARTGASTGGDAKRLGQSSLRVVTVGSGRSTTQASVRKQSQRRHGVPATAQPKRQERATEGEAARGKSEQAQEAQASRPEAHAGKPEEPRGGSEENRAEGVAKGAATEGQAHAPKE
jgi:RNA polymerase sigma factor (sigma-70 family)